MKHTPAVREARPTKYDPFIKPPKEDDRSGHGHRLVIGVLGLALPSLLLVLDWARPTEGLGADQLTSMSAYYYSEAIVAFVGVLACVAVCFFLYDGYGNEDRAKDRAAGILAGITAVLVVLFPTEPAPGFQPSWWAGWMGVVHYGAAIGLLLTLAYFSLVRFTSTGSSVSAMSDEERWRYRWFKLFGLHADEFASDASVEEARRRWVYRACGWSILGCIVWAGALKVRDGNAPIFLPEAAAIVFFAASWLIKGRAGWSVSVALRRMPQYARHPLDLANSVVGNELPRRS